MVGTKNEFLCSSVFEWGTKKGLEFKVACLSICFSAKIRQCRLGSHLHHHAEIGELVGPACFASKHKVDM